MAGLVKERRVRDAITHLGCADATEVINSILNLFPDMYPAPINYSEKYVVLVNPKTHINITIEIARCIRT
jgi:hypothetical protein